jgi:hypothetical protein
MARREQIRPRRSGGTGRPDGDPRLEPLPRRTVADTTRAAQVLERIRRVLEGLVER